MAYRAGSRLCHCGIECAGFFRALRLQGRCVDASNQMTESGITVTAYAGQYDDNADFNLWNPGTWPTNQNEDAITTLDCSTSSSCSRTVADTSLGLGVGGRHDSAWIDGFNGNDLLTLRFSREVNFHDVVFAGWDSRYDSFDLFVDGVLVAPEERTGSGAFSLAGLTGTLHQLRCGRVGRCLQG
jgi:hypothetical protein